MLIPYLRVRFKSCGHANRVFGAVLRTGRGNGFSYNFWNTSCNIASNIQLTKSERRELAHVLHNAYIVDGVKVNVMSAIDIMVKSLKRIILDASTEKLKLPMIQPIESMEGITE